MITELCDLNASMMRRLMRRGEVSPVCILESCIKRIETANCSVNAIVSKCFDRARKEAQLAEKMLLRGENVPPLHGIPLAVKDLNDTGGLRTTYGSLLYKDHIPQIDDDLVSNLRKAGAILLGKTNTPEFGAGSNTDNRVFGPTRNPFNLDYTPGGSSGGSAVAVATGMVPLAHGTDTFGSLRNPAAWCGIVGFRPSPGLIPSPEKKLNYSHFNVQGPMAKTVEDASLMMSVMATYDAKDIMSRPCDKPKFLELKEVDLSKLKVGWTTSFSGAALIEKGIRQTFEHRMRVVSGLFARTEKINFEFSGARETLWTLRCLYFLANFNEIVTNGSKLISSNIINNVEAGQSMSLLDAANAELNWVKIYQEFQSIFEEIDFLIAPGNSVSPFTLKDGIPKEIDGVRMQNYVEASMVRSIVTLSGLPVVVIPAGVDSMGFPFGIQIVGRRYGDKALLEMAAKLQSSLEMELKISNPKPIIQDLS